MLRKLSLAIAVSGLLVASIPSTVAASTWTLTATPNVSCSTSGSAGETVAWSSGHGKFINLQLEALLYINGNYNSVATATYLKVDTSTGTLSSVPNMISWNVSAGSHVRVIVYANQLNGGGKVVSSATDYTDCYPS